MGNKQNGRPPAPIRAHSTTTPPTAAAAATVGSSNQQLASAAGAHHHRISRRRSEFQQGSRRQHSDNNSTATMAAGTVNNSSAGSSTTNQQLYSSGGSGGGNNTLAPATDRAVVVINHPPNSSSSNSTETERERTRQNRRRWSSAANVHPRASQQVVKPKRMSPRQCHLVIKAWSRRAPKSRVVKDIFAAIFTEAEELKSAFGIETSSVGKRLRTDTNFLQHTNMFADTLDFVIRNLDDLSLVTENAEQLGRRHAGFPLENGFRPEYWSIFTECIVDGVCTGEEDKETQIAWRQLVQTIVYYMKLGYDREMLRITRHSSFRRSNSPMTRGRVQQDRPSSSSGLSSVTLDEQRLLLLRPAEEKMPPAANDCRKTIGYHRDHYQ